MSKAHLLLAATRIPAQLSDALDEYCEATGLSRSEAIRSAIQHDLKSAGYWPPVGHRGEPAALAVAATHETLAAPKAKRVQKSRFG